MSTKQKEVEKILKSLRTWIDDLKKKDLIINEDWKNINAEKIKLIIVGDNPGNEEEKERKYLIGPSGKQLRNFIREKLKIDVNTEVVYLNKTPIHTKSTNELENYKDQELLNKTLKRMAEDIVAIHVALNGINKNIQLWIIGKSQLKKGKIFETFSDSILSSYSTSGHEKLFKNLMVYSHFSYGNFHQELNKLPQNMKTKEKLSKIGRENRDKVFKGFPNFSNLIPKNG